MIDLDSFISLCEAKEYSLEAIQKIKIALSLSQETLSSKKRLAGDLFFDHNVRSARILAENKSSPEIVIASLLQGILPIVSENEIQEQFGVEIPQLLRGIAELKALKFKNQQLEADSLRKIILTTLQDVRAVLIKLANKIDNLQNIHVLPMEEQQRIAQEVLDVYAPLASHLGVDRIKSQLEDLAFKTLNPPKYQEIETFLHESREERENAAQNLIAEIQRIAYSIPLVKIKARPKHMYSMYKKINSKGIKLTDLYDLLGVRVIVPEEKDCYVLLGLLHEQFEPVEGRLKDYITNPKPNLYRSLHTAVKLPSGKIAEIQIRTPEMDEFAEEGIAAHWRYKGIKSEQSFEKKISWLRSVMDLQQDIEKKEFLETMKVDVFGDSMYCYTPKGDVKELPLLATLLDFAYLVHEEIGNHAVAGRVNGKFVPLKHQLVQGDVVEIITNKNQRPRRSWIKFVRSARAKQKIRKLLKEYEKLPAMHYRVLQSEVNQEQGVLAFSPQFPQAFCLLAKCCTPLPGEEITGIVTKRRMISVHEKNCRHALKEEERWVAVQWKDTFNQKINFTVQAEERSGLLADLLHTIASAGFEVKEAKAKLVGNNNAECSFSVIPRDLEHLQEVVKRMNKVKGINRVWFE